MNCTALSKPEVFASSCVPLVPNSREESIWRVMKRSFTHRDEIWRSRSGHKMHDGVLTGMEYREWLNELLCCMIIKSREQRNIFPTITHLLTHNSTLRRYANPLLHFPLLLEHAVSKHYAIHARKSTGRGPLHAYQYPTATTRRTYSIL